jgi:hypothetical protein
MHAGSRYRQVLRRRWYPVVSWALYLSPGFGLRKAACGLVSKRQVLRDPIKVSGSNERRFSQKPAAFWALPWHRWRRPAPRKRTLPAPVILKPLLTDFLVLIPLGRRIGVLTFDTFPFRSFKTHDVPSSGGWVRRAGTAAAIPAPPGGLMHSSCSHASLAMRLCVPISFP